MKDISFFHWIEEIKRPIDFDDRMLFQFSLSVKLLSFPKL
jgi:hypothetical protein